MKNFKALQYLKEVEHFTPEEIKCACCEQIKRGLGIDTGDYIGVNICLDCLQYTKTQERIEQLESWLYPEDKEFENND